jgi:hypothetical protein
VAEGPWNDYAATAAEAPPWMDYAQQPRSFDSVNGQLVPTGSPAAKAAQSPVATADPNSPQPVESEIGAMVSNGLSSVGKSFVDLGRGAGQYLGLVSRQDVQDARDRDAPLMATGAGKVGSIIGNVAATVPALAIPGANTVAGAGLIGAATGALQPSVSTGETLRNTALGGALGAGGQAVGNAVAAGAQRILASRATAATNAETVNAVRDSTLKQSQDVGYVVPPTATNPSLKNTALESASGRYATKQAAQVKNQQVTNRLAAEDLGLPANQPITQQALNDVRAKAGQVYAQVKKAGTIQTDADYLNALTSITNASEDVAKAFPGATTPAADKIDTLVNSLSQDSFSAAQAVEYAKRLRQQSAANFKLAGRSANPEDLALAQAQSKGANALEEMIGRHLDSTGKPDLLKEFQDARKSIAKSYTVDAALNDATGNVDARILAKQLERNAGIDGGLRKAGEFGQAFGEVAGEPVKGPGVSKLAFASAAGGALLGQPQLLALPVASTIARKTLLSGPVNRALATPTYAPGALGTITLNALKQSPRAVLPGTAATLPLIEANQ